MSRTFIIGVAFIGLAVVFAVVILQREKSIIAVSPAAQYAVPQERLKSMAAKANAGDCEAASTLADFYLNVAIDFDAGLKWSRLGATCPGVRPKERLIYLLAQVEPSDVISSEIAKLLSEIRQLAPAEAERVAAGLPAERRLMNNQGRGHPSH